MKRRTFYSLAWISLTVIVCPGCELFPPAPPPPLGGATNFTQATGGILGAAQGQIVALRPDLLDRPDLRDAAFEASRRAETRPGLYLDAINNSASAPAHPDLDNDGFLTLAEVVALARSNLDPDAVARAISTSGYRLIASRPQVDYLRVLGVPEAVLAVFPLPPEPKPRRWPLVD